MIARLFGRIAEKQPNRLIVDVSGVGYDVQVPLSTYYVSADIGGEMALRIHTHVREDQLSLYGFATELELTMFERLIAVSGIGPKLALAVLSGIEPRDLAGAIQRNVRAPERLRASLAASSLWGLPIRSSIPVALQVSVGIGWSAGASPPVGGTGAHAQAIVSAARAATARITRPSPFASSSACRAEP